MIRVETEDGWLLIAHQDHARMAGAFAKHWGNPEIAAPEPFEDILVAVSRHDDAWAKRDAAPLITPDGKPSAFSSELVGTYSAFENIDLADYLAVRGAATEAVAGENPLAATLISMHTVNLLTEQADLSTLPEDGKALHARFIENQLARQGELKTVLGPENCPEEGDIQRAFEFLQACDSFSLVSCVQYPDPIPLRHKHPTLDGGFVTITCFPESDNAYRLDPWPLKKDSIQLTIPAIEIKGKQFDSNAALQKAFVDGKKTEILVTVHR